MKCNAITDANLMKGLALKKIIGKFHNYKEVKSCLTKFSFSGLDRPITKSVKTA